MTVQHDTSCDGRMERQFEIMAKLIRWCWILGIDLAISKNVTEFRNDMSREQVVLRFSAGNRQSQIQFRDFNQFEGAIAYHAKAIAHDLLVPEFSP